MANFAHFTNTDLGFIRSLVKFSLFAEAPRMFFTVLSPQNFFRSLVLLNAGKILPTALLDSKQFQLSRRAEFFFDFCFIQNFLLCFLQRAQKFYKHPQLDTQQQCTSQLRGTQVRPGRYPPVLTKAQWCPILAAFPPTARRSSRRHLYRSSLSSLLSWGVPLTLP